MANATGLGKFIEWIPPIAAAAILLSPPAEAQQSFGKGTRFTPIHEEGRPERAGSRGGRPDSLETGNQPQPVEQHVESLRRLPQEADYVGQRKTCGEGEENWNIAKGQNLVHYLERMIPDYDKKQGNFPRELDQSGVERVPYIEYGFNYPCLTLTEFLDVLMRDYHGTELHFRQHLNVVEMISR